jgi:hypothetical protein
MDFVCNATIQGMRVIRIENEGERSYFRIDLITLDEAEGDEQRGYIPRTLNWLFETGPGLDSALQDFPKDIGAYPLAAEVRCKTATFRDYNKREKTGLVVKSLKLTGGKTKAA